MDQVNNWSLVAKVGGALSIVAGFAPEAVGLGFQLTNSSLNVPLTAANIPISTFLYGGGGLMQTAGIVLICSALFYDRSKTLETTPLLNHEPDFVFYEDDNAHPGIATASNETDKIYSTISTDSPKQGSRAGNPRLEERIHTTTSTITSTPRKNEKKQEGPGQPETEHDDLNDEFALTSGEQTSAISLDIDHEKETPNAGLNGNNTGDSASMLSSSSDDLEEIKQALPSDFLDGQQSPGKKVTAELNTASNEQEKALTSEDDNTSTVIDSSTVREISTDVDRFSVSNLPLEALAKIQEDFYQYQIDNQYNADAMSEAEKPSATLVRKSVEEELVPSSQKSNVEGAQSFEEQISVVSLDDTQEQNEPKNGDNLNREALAIDEQAGH